MKNNQNRSKIKETIIDTLKFMILVTVMVMGFWLIYGIIWIGCGLPTAGWAIGVLFALAVFSEAAFVLWLNN